MTRQPVTLLFTNSIDYVADLLVKNLGPEQVFRYNTDLWQDYKLLVSDRTIEIEDPIGRRVTEGDIVKVFRRSSMRASNIFPATKLTDAERYDEEEVWMALSDILNIFWEQGKVVLNQPLATTRSCKMQQLRVAAEYFDVTPFRFVVGAADQLRPGTQAVAKSFTFKFADGIGFYARKVDEGSLDPAHPWFLTDFVEADEDVTVALVRDELFAYALARSRFSQIPSTGAKRLRRMPTGLETRLPPALSQAIFAFAADIGIHYARLDFLRKDSRYTFLEANYAGEWGWLDPDNQNGLMAKILQEIDPRTPLVGCPRPHWR